MTSTPEGRPATVSAVILTLGEATTARAIQSVSRQTIPISEIIIIEGITPFHLALNAAAARVDTPFFVQVDADMVLDDDCVERLLAAAGPRTAAVVGHLRDPMYGDVQGVKLFRSSCFANGGFRDEVSPDTEFLDRLAGEGWTTVVAGHHGGRKPRWTFGAHLPDYDNPVYVYGKFHVEGRRWHSRRNAGALRHRLALLHRSRHPQAMLAEIAMSHGVFRGDERDLLEPYGPTADYERVMRLLTSRGRHESGALRAVRLYSCLSPRAAFACGWAAGDTVRDGAAREIIAATLDTLHRSMHPFDWLTELGFCRGLLRDSGVTAGQDWERLGVFKDYYRWRGVAARLGARVITR